MSRLDRGRLICRGSTGECARLHGLGRLPMSLLASTDPWMRPQSCRCERDAIVCWRTQRSRLKLEGCVAGEEGAEAAMKHIA